MRVDIGDDAAVRHDGVVITVDTLVEGVHFRGHHRPEDLGQKTLAVSVSDVVAMGARPDHAVLALSLPSGRRRWLDRFAAGLAQACASYGVDLVGGDTTRSPGPIVVTLTLLGTLTGEPWRRDGAVVGDRLLVTGTLGLPGAGWMDATPTTAASRALAVPVPPYRVPDAFAAEGIIVHAAMDLSDGLAVDAPRMAAASGVALRLRPEALPAHPEVAARSDRLALQTCGGEDYQLLIAVPPHEVGRAVEAAARAGTTLTEIGEVVAGAGAYLVGAEWPSGAFDHFPERQP